MAEDVMAKGEHQGEGGIGDLVKDALKDAQELMKIEVALARNEVQQDINKLKGSAIAFGLAAVGAILMLAMLLMAAALALGGVAPALIMAGVLLVWSATAAYVGYKLIPREAPLENTQKHAETQAKILKERIA